MTVTGALVGIVVTAPLMLVLAALIRLESKGWPLFLQTRVTRNGHRFGCLKLRTIHAATHRLEVGEIGDTPRSLRRHGAAVNRRRDYRRA